MSLEARNFILDLCSKTAVNRLGHDYPEKGGGYIDVKQHEWFTKIEMDGRPGLDFRAIQNGDGPGGVSEIPTSQ